MRHCKRLPPAPATCAPARWRWSRAFTAPPSRRPLSGELPRPASLPVSALPRRSSHPPIGPGGEAGRAFLAAAAAAADPMKPCISQTVDSYQKNMFFCDVEAFFSWSTQSQLVSWIDRPCLAFSKSFKSALHVIMPNISLFFCLECDKNNSSFSFYNFQ